MDFTLAEEMLNKYSLEELEGEVLADVELERGNKQNGCLIALDVEQIRSKALRKLDIELERY